MDKDTDEARLAAHRAMHRVVHPDVAEGWRKQHDDERRAQADAHTAAVIRHIVRRLNDGAAVLDSGEFGMVATAYRLVAEVLKTTAADIAADVANEQPTTEQMLAALGPCGK